MRIETTQRSGSIGNAHSAKGDACSVRRMSPVKASWLRCVMVVQVLCWLVSTANAQPDPGSLPMPNYPIVPCCTLGPPDAQPPSVPTGLTATVINATQINLTWNAASDNVGVYIYQILQGGALRGTVGAPQVNFSDTGLAGLTTYTYSVAACDFSFNCSALSVPVSVTTPIRTNPDLFFFAAQNGVARNIVVVSNSITVSGIAAPAPISIVGGEYSINGGAFTANAGTVTNGQSVAVRLTSPATYGGTAAATLNIGGVSATFNVATPAINTAVYFPLVQGYGWVTNRNGSPYATSTVSTSQIVNGVTTTGITDTAVDGELTSFYTNDANGLRLHRLFTPATDIPGCGIVAETDTLNTPMVLLPASGTIGQSVTTSGTLIADAGVCGNLALGYASTSTLQAFERVMVPAGHFDALKVRVALQVAGPSTTTTIWYAPGVGQVKELNEDGTLYELASTNIIRTVPDDFSFAPQTGVPPNSSATSSAVTIGGITTPTSISITGGEYSINGGAFTNQPGSVSNGQSIQGRLTSSTQGGATAAAVLSVGGVTATFSVTTGAGAPSAPSVINLTAGISSVNVSFAPPASDGGSAITGYRAECQSSDGGAPGVGTGDAAARSIQVSGLTNGKRYSCSVAALNGFGAGPASPVSNPITPIDLTPILQLLLD